MSITRIQTAIQNSAATLKNTIESIVTDRDFLKITNSCIIGVSIGTNLALYTSTNRVYAHKIGEMELKTTVVSGVIGICTATLFIICKQLTQRNAPLIPLPIAAPDLKPTESDMNNTYEKRFFAIGLSNSSIPHRLICPISHAIFLHPIIASDGHTYEKFTFQRWIKDHARSPLTNLPINREIIINNHNKKSEVITFIEKKEKRYWSHVSSTLFTFPTITSPTSKSEDEVLSLIKGYTLDQ